ncbi:RHS repeat-associated core domain-containing protein [Thermoflexus hugenholtzii]
MDWRFTGQRWEASLGLYDYKARFYDPLLGRFLQPDPIVPEPGNPQALNRYAYVYNNPLRYVDGGGHLPVVPLLMAGAIIALKVIDYGWTAYEAWHSLRVLQDPNASPEARAEAAANLALTSAFEAGEPDDLLPIGLPLDDLARVGLIGGVRKIGKEAGETATRRAAQAGGEEAAEELPSRMHHFATNKNRKWTPQFAEILQNYGLDLDEAWNQEFLPQRGHHLDAYHEWVLEQMGKIDKKAQGNREVFLELFEQWVKIVSERVKQALEELKATEGVQFLPIRVIRKETGEEAPGYYVLHVWRHISALDEEHTKFIEPRDEKYPELSIAVVALRREALRGVDIFRLKVTSRFTCHGG